MNIKEDRYTRAEYVTLMCYSEGARSYCLLFKLNAAEQHITRIRRAFTFHLFQACGCYREADGKWRENQWGFIKSSRQSFAWTQLNYSFHRHLLQLGKIKAVKWSEWKGISICITATSHRVRTNLLLCASPLTRKWSPRPDSPMSARMKHRRPLLKTPQNKGSGCEFSGRSWRIPPGVFAPWCFARLHPV